MIVEKKIVFLSILNHIIDENGKIIESNVEEDINVIGFINKESNGLIRLDTHIVNRRTEYIGDKACMFELINNTQKKRFVLAPCKTYIYKCNDEQYKDYKMMRAINWMHITDIILKCDFDKIEFSNHREIKKQIDKVRHSLKHQLSI